MRAALESLPPQMRRCLRLRLERQSTYREIATLLRVSIDTVKTHLRQGRHRLRAALAETETAAEAGSATQ